MRILLAEDDRTSRTILTSVLRKWGFTVQAVTDGIAAFDVLQQPDSPRLAILDRVMPGMDGLEVCRRIRQSETSVPRYIIMLTSLDSRDDIVAGLGAGADDYVSKPFDHEELGARIRVGRRVLELQSSVVEKEKLSGVVEMAGAICHELNQPLQVISAAAELLLMDLDEGAPEYQEAQTIARHVARLGELNTKIMTITAYKTRDYLNGKIIDIHGVAAGSTVNLNP